MVKSMRSSGGFEVAKEAILEAIRHKISSSCYHRRWPKPTMVLAVVTEAVAVLALFVVVSSPAGKTTYGNSSILQIRVEGNSDVLIIQSMGVIMFQTSIRISYITSDCGLGLVDWSFEVYILRRTED